MFHAPEKFTATKRCQSCGSISRIPTRFTWWSGRTAPIPIAPLLIKMCRPPSFAIVVATLRAHAA